jgi:hypothetical protein
MYLLLLLPLLVSATATAEHVPIALLRHHNMMGVKKINQVNWTLNGIGKFGDLLVHPPPSWKINFTKTNQQNPQVVSELGHVLGGAPMGVDLAKGTFGFFIMKQKCNVVLIIIFSIVTTCIAIFWWFSKQYTSKNKSKSKSKSTKASVTATLLFSMLVSQHLPFVNGHFRTLCVGTGNRATAANDICSDEDVYVYMSQTHTQMTASCYRNNNQGRIDVSTAIPYSRRPSVGNNMNYATMLHVPACIGSTATGSNTICKAEGMQPHHCGGGSVWHRYGPINQQTGVGKTFTVKYWGGSCTSRYVNSVKKTITFTTNLCQCSNPGQGLQGRKTCVNCAKGEASLNNKSPCLPCVAGRYQDQNVATSWGCKTCEAGRVASSSTSSCAACPVGQSQEKDIANSYLCNKCSVGKHAPTNKVVCENCVSGQYQTKSVATSHSCSACNIGKYAKSKSVTSCSNCEKGRFQNLAAATEYQCKLCTTGRYGDQLNLATCKGCPSGKNLMDVGALILGRCTDCITGLYNPFEGHPSACLLCPSAGAGATTCVGCAPGEMKLPNDGGCVDCGAGKFTDERDLESCKQCPKAYYTNDIKSSDGLLRKDRCASCPRGTWGNTMETKNVNECIECTAGQYNDIGGSMIGCKKCPKGTYSTAKKNTKDSDCENCASGKYSNSLSANARSSCIKCRTGKYSPTVGATSESLCKKCVLGYEQLSDGLSYCLPCTPGKFGKADDDGYSICLTCPNNYYQALTEKVSCTACPTGRTSDMGSVSCSLCPAGWHVNGQGCSSCLPGKYQKDLEKESCLPCKRGKIAVSSGMPACSVCNNGQHMNHTGKENCDLCAVGKFKKEQLFEGDPATLYLCKMCPVGTYNTVIGQSACLPCIPGSYQNELGSSSCKLCSKNEYRGNKMDATVCVKCPAGKKSAVSSAQCQNCGAGSYGDVLGAGCLECPSGSFRATALSVPSTACTKCVPGHFQNDKAQASCLPCIPGTYTSDEGSSSGCKSCQENEYRSFDMEATACKKCPLGWLSSIGSAKCLQCAAGNYGDVLGGGCKKCAIGTYRSASDPSSSCFSCSKGKYQGIVEQSSCLPCIPGQYTNEKGASVCKDCPDKTFSSKTEQPICVDCPTGWITGGTGFATCTPCLAGRAGLDCSTCIEGQYRASGIVNEDPTTCVVCPQGYHQPTTVSIDIDNILFCVSDVVIYTCFCYLSLLTPLLSSFLLGASIVFTLLA